MKTRGFWLGRQQMRWLIVLLALMPLVPTGIIVRDLIKSGDDERELAIAFQMEAERVQLVSIANRLSHNHAGPKDQAELHDELTRIFGDDSFVWISTAEGSGEGPAAKKWSDQSVETRIAGGRFDGWKVWLAREFEAPYFLEEQLRKRWWLAVAIMGGISLVAAAIWWAVNRGLRVDELRSDLLATVAHEMKTPLSSMRVLLETLAEGTVSDPEKQEEYFGLLQRENARLSRLTEDFLTIGRLERGDIRLKPEDVALAQLIEEVIEELEPSFAGAKSEIRTRVEPGLRVLADRDGLFMVVTNLLENALKYGGDDPEIQVDGLDRGDSVELSVSDSGPGIPRELRKMIFRRYFRIDRRLSEGTSGVGLGLAICRQMVRKMGGRIRAESSGSGNRGLRIVVILPAIKSVEENETAETEPKLHHASSVDR